MSENKKQGNAQIPREAISGAAGQNAQFYVASISNEQILENSLNDTYETKVTNQYMRDIKSIDLQQGSVIKAYDNEPKLSVNQKSKNQEIGREE